MNKRLTERERLLNKLDRLSEGEITEVLDYVNLIEAAKESTANPPFAESPDDETLLILSGAYENRRARQVLEWDDIRRRADSLASARHYARP
jgi:hypothetical protein